ncbi:MAG: amino acid adenylation domain-containing protein [Rivularia sp. (in: Bacteria)]|nr:amino acid adenylation domain-containing protein [Rivularia sp. MS3]
MDNQTDTDKVIKRRSNLSAAKRAILEKRLRGEHQSNVQQVVIPRRSQQNMIPLSAPQQRLWFLQQLEPESFVYNEFACMHLKGILNVAALEKSLNEIVKRHQSLRTCFQTLNEQQVQVICPSLTIGLPVVDLRGLSTGLQDIETKRLTAEIVQEPFDLTSAPLLRVMLLQTGEQEYLLLLVIHHIICDGWSIQVLNQELAAIYKAFSTGKSSPLSPLPIQYPDYSIWQQQWLQGEREKTQSYWQQQLADAPSSLSLPTDYQRPPVQSFKGATIEFELSPQLSERLRCLSKQQGVTLFMTLLAAFQVLLYRYTSQEDICIGSPIANRDRDEIQGLIGFFVNTLALRTDLSGNPSFLELLHRVRQVCVGAYAHAEIPFEQLVAELHPERNLSHTPLFQVTFALQSDTKTDLVLPDLTLKWLQNHSETAKFDLSLYVVDSQPQLRGWWEYNTDLFDATTIERMVGHWINLLEGIVAQPDKRLSELPLLTEAERQTLLVDWNNTATNYPEDKCIHQLFAAQVEKTPDAIAAVFENQQLTYRELNNRANQLAHYLRSMQVKSQVLVGIYVERSLDMLIGLLAILKAGGAYVPLDPIYPQERIGFILEETQAPVLLTQSTLLETIPQHQAQVVCLDSDWHLIAQQSQENLSSLATSDDLAYIIYTSGSTGKPKGVQISHGALSNFLYSMQQAPGLTSSDVLLAVTTYSFDIAALELFLPIIVGARVVIASREIVADGIRLSATLMDTKATVMQATPATWQLLLGAGWDGDSQLKILCGGEALPRNLANQLLKRCRCLWNMYGPTETTIWSAASQVEMGDNIVPIGKPIANTQLYILDKHNQLVPVGVTGELCIGGRGLAKGYLHRFDLTAEKFIPNPFSNKEGDTPLGVGFANRLYKTGDLARYLPSGNIEYIGRIDNQVKLRGYRIELGEIEAVIGQYKAVRETVVIIGDSANSGLIIAYVVVREQQILVIDELQSFVESKLPKYMVPFCFVTLEALPLTPNGKVDRKALVVPDLTQISSADIVTASTPVESLLTGIWAKILGIEKIGINSNFFALGGHSLIATRVISQIQQVFQVELPLRDLFETPTIAGLAQKIEKAITLDSAVTATNIKRISRCQQLPISFAQQRLWFLTQLEKNSPFYNISAAVRLKGKLNVEALQKSFNEIVLRHETLRTNFLTKAGQPLVVISEAKPLTLSILDICSNGVNQQAEVQQQIAREAQQPFDIGSDCLLRIKLLRLAEQEHIILVTMHHIVSDGWSMGILVQELTILYPIFCDNNVNLKALPALPIQYVDFAAWQRQLLQGEVLENHLSYWLKQLENAPKVLELPTDYPRGKIQTYRGATYSFKLSTELSAKLNKLSQQHGVTLFMTLLAGFQTLLYRYTTQEDIVVGSPIANRNRAEIEQLIGFFVNTLVLRTNLAGNPSFVELLKRVREVALGAYVHQNLPFELLVEQLQPQRDLSHTPLFQVMFVLENAPISALELPGLSLNFLESHSDSAKFDLTLYMAETESGLNGTFEYNTDLFKESTIERMVSHLQTLLEAITVNPQQRLSELPLLTASEQHQLLVDWNDTQVEYSQHQCIHKLFEEQVEKTPDAIAVVFENQQLTYRELNNRANQLANYLRSLKVKPEVLVGICVERCLEMVIGLLGILKAGGAYVPLDPNYPQERLAFMLEDSQIPILLSQQHLVENLPAHKAEVICLDSDWDKIARSNSENITCNLNSDNLAYVIYTSGSTGKPKGAMNTHKGVCNRLLWMQDTYKLTTTDRVLQKTPFSFDVSVWEFFWTLMTGACLIIAKPEGHKDSNYLVKIIEQQQITTLHFVPSMLQIFVDEPGIEHFQCLKRVFCSGEALSSELQHKFFARCENVELHNLYGPTEAAIDVTFWHCQPGTQENIIPIGRPIANTQIYILDKQLQPVPVGIPGELHIAGMGLARGYLNRLQLTKEKFIANPFSNQPGEKLYKTGDLARYLENGVIEYLGRIDNQVKIRGFRIELGEIESVIQQILEIKQAVVIVSHESNRQQIVAYIILNSDSQKPEFNYLREFLKQKLPDYMIPSAFIIIDSLPLTPNGKLDYHALPTPKITLNSNHQKVLARNPIEKQLTEIWAEVLDLIEISIHENFFTLGGHSLLATQIMSKIRQIWQIELPLSCLFEMPTIALLSAEIVKSLEQEPEKSVKAPQRLSRKARSVKLSSLNAENKINN